MTQDYNVDIMFNGRLRCTVSANSEQEALDKANMIANGTNLAPLTDVDWTVTEPVPVKSRN